MAGPTDPPVAQPPPAPLARIPFSPRAEASIRALAGWMQTAAVINFLAAGAKLVGSFTPRHHGGHVIDAVVTFLVGWWVYQAGVAFRKVATTDEADQRYLMEGFTRLRYVYLLQTVMLGISLAFIVIALVVAGVVLATHGPRG